MPQLQGKLITQGDIVHFTAMSKEISDLKKETGEVALWTGSMFSGMPTYQIGLPQNSNLLKYVPRMSRLFFGNPIGMIISLMIGFYILSIILRIDYRIGIIGSVLFAFSTFYIGLIEGGHNSKIHSIVFMPMIIGALYLIYEKKKLLTGSILFSFGLAINILANHIQMTYYLGLALLLMTIIYLIKAIREKKIGEFLKFNSFLVVGAVLALATSASRMWPTYEYTKDTMRGKPILTNNVDPSSSSSKDGLAYDYAMLWSNGGLDLLSTVIPSVAGGGNEPIPEGSALDKNFKNRGINVPIFNLYWGKLDFTGSSQYISIIFWLFFLYMVFGSRSRIRNWIIAAVILTFIISLGKHFSIINRLFFDYLPMFDKFRAHNSIMAVSSIFVALGGMYGMNLFFFLKKKNSTKTNTLIKSAISLGIIFLGALILGFIFDFTSSGDSTYAESGIIPDMIATRKSMYFNSLFGTLAVAAILIGGCFLWLKNKISAPVAISIIGLLGLINLWSVDRKYISKDDFVEPKNYESNFEPRDVDLLIMKDVDPHYRVLDLTTNPFASPALSYHHKSIGGYHAAKLQRYQDLIDYHLSKFNQQVLNMLNTKYFIQNDANNVPQMQLNVNALGNAWFVDQLIKVKTAEEEINALNGITGDKMAVIHNEFDEYLQGLKLQKEGTISLTSYHPNKIVYNSNSSAEQMAIFSEIWYGPDKGWQASIDGTKVDHIRANYVLRALRVPAGEHEIVFEFNPKSYRAGSIISLGSSSLIILLLLGLFLKSIGILDKKKKA
jgi:hypothetical protein